MKTQKNADSQIHFTDYIDQTLFALAELSRVQEKSILYVNYYKHQETHERRLAIARKHLMDELRLLESAFDHGKFTGKKKVYGQSFVDEAHQLQLDLVSLACLRFRVGDDPDAFKLKDKLHKFLRTLSNLIEALVSFRKQKGKKPNSELLERQLQVLMEAFAQAYPLDPEDEYEFSLEADDDDDLLLLDDEAVSLKYDDAFEALQGFIAAAQITLRDLSQIISSLSHWRESDE